MTCIFLEAALEMERMDMKRLSPTILAMINRMDLLPRPYQLFEATDWSTDDGDERRREIPL